MAGIRPTDATDLAVREPRQRRTREQWGRILDAGVRLLEEEGYDGFTIAALCTRAGVPPRALYARTASKDALFLAVYEHGMARVLAGHERFTDRQRWNVDDDRRRVDQAVRDLVRIFLDNALFLRAVVLISSAHPEVRRRGTAYRDAISALFSDVLAPAQPDRRQREFCFALIFSALVVRSAYGPGFGPAGDLDVLTRELVTMAQRYLLPGG